MRKVLNKNKLFYFVMISLILVVIIVIGVKFTLEFLVKDEKNVVTKKELDSLELYGYTLDDYDSDLYKEYFNKLKVTLNEDHINYEDYAKELVMLYVVDFYTLSNKIKISLITDYMKLAIKTKFRWSVFIFCNFLLQYVKKY